MVKYSVSTGTLSGSFDYTAQLVRDAGATPTAGTVGSMATYTVAYY